MRIVKSVSFAKGHQRNTRGGELLTRREGPFKRHQVRVVENANTYAVRIVPADNLRPLHIARYFTHNGDARAGSPIGQLQSRIL